MYNYTVYNADYYHGTFQEVWEKASDFVTDYKTSGVNTSAQAMGLNQITDSELTMIYYLLYSRYGNNPYAADDLYRFKYNLFSTIFMYAPTWLKRLDIQNKLRNLTDDELINGTISIMSNAATPGESKAPTELINGINTQNVASTKKSKIAAYSDLVDLLKTDVTDQFLEKFKKLFLYVVAPQFPYLYKNEIIQEDATNDT